MFIREKKFCTALSLVNKTFSKVLLFSKTETVKVYYFQKRYVICNDLLLPRDVLSIWGGGLRVAFLSNHS